MVNSVKGAVMFVSSYNTYISSNSTDKTAKVVQERERGDKSSFASKLFAKSSISTENLKNLPINYISSNTALANKQELDYQRMDQKNTALKDTKELTEMLSKQSTLSSAKSAYLDNSKMFSFLQKPKVTLSQTPQIDSRQDNSTQDIEEKNLRHTMVNTYLENDKYYQITA